MSAKLGNRVYGIPILPALPGHLAMTQGRIYHVKPSSGNDGNTGLTVDKAFKTLSQAQTAATADQNDIVLLYAESNTAASTTDYQSSTLTWAKDGVHLIGVNSGIINDQRSRVAFTSTYDTASNLFTLSADNCYIANIQFYAGVAGTNPTGCMSVTGDRNLVENCHIAGIGHDNNDIAGAYSVSLSAAIANVFKHCTIGLSTIARGTQANSEILIASDSARDIFEDCLILTYGEANTHQFVIMGASATTDWMLFKNCIFINRMNATDSVSLLEVFDLSSSSNDGQVVLYKCSFSGAAAWEATSGASTILYTDSTLADAATGGRMLAVTGA